MQPDQKLGAMETEEKEKEKKGNNWIQNSDSFTENSSSLGASE
jgi:hypothetical protein